MIDDSLKKPHYKSVIFASYLEIMRNEYPSVDLKKICLECGLSLAYISDENNWVSVVFEKRLMDKFQELTNDKNIYYKAGTKSMSREGLGTPLYFLARHVFSLRTIYSTIPKLTALLNKVIKIQLIKMETGYFVFNFIPILNNLTPEEYDALLSRMHVVMENTQGYFSAIPTIKGLPPAKVVLNEKFDKNGSVFFELIVEYLVSAEIFEKIQYILPFLIFTVSAYLFNFIYKFTLKVSIAYSSIFFLLSFLFLFIKNNNHLRKIANQAERALFRLDEQYKELFEIQSKLKRKLGETEATFNLVASLIASSSEGEVLTDGCRALVEHLNYDRSFVLVADEKGQELRFASSFGFKPELSSILEKLKLPVDINDNDERKFSNIFRLQKPLLVTDVEKHFKFLTDNMSKVILERSGTTSFVAVPVSTRNSCFGILVADCVSKRKVMGNEDLNILNTAAQQIAIAIEKQKAKQMLVEAYENEVKIAEAYSKFVPWETLKVLNYKDIFDVKLGDGVVQNLAVMFSDIRGFTTLAESMTPREVLQFLNSYYARLVPLIKKYKGNVDKYIGDAVMAVFPTMREAVCAAIEMQRQLVQYNLNNRIGKRMPISAGVGICAGPVIFGPLGSDKRLEITALSDTVNIASRLDGLCKGFDANILVSGEFDFEIDKGEWPDLLGISHGNLNVRGKLEQVNLIEIIDSNLIERQKNNIYTHKENVYIEDLERKIKLKMKKAGKLRKIINSNIKKTA